MLKLLLKISTYEIKTWTKKDKKVRGFRIEYKKQNVSATLDVYGLMVHEARYYRTKTYQYFFRR